MSKKSIFLLTVLIIIIVSVTGYCYYDSSIKEKRNLQRKACLSEVDTYINKIESALLLNEHSGYDSYTINNGAIMDNDKEILYLDNRSTDGRIRVDGLDVVGAEINIEYENYRYYIIYDGKQVEALN